MEKMLKESVKLARTGEWERVDEIVSKIKTRLKAGSPKQELHTKAVATHAIRLLDSEEGCLRDLGATYISALPTVNPEHFKSHLLPSSDVPRGVHDEDYCARFRAACAVVDHFGTFKELVSKDHLIAIKNAFTQMKQKEPDLKALVVSYERRFEKISSQKHKSKNNKVPFLDFGTC